MIEPLTSADVGLGNVDNTSDADKPLSTAATTALAGKSDTGHTHTISNVTDLSAASICKAWVNFNGKSVATGAITPAAAYGVSGVNKTATGKYIVALSATRPDANYVVTSTMGATDDNYDGDWAMVVYDINPSFFEVHIYDKTNGVYKDLNLLMFAVFGN